MLMCDFLYGAVSKKDYNKKFIEISLKYNIPVDYTFESSLFPLKKSNNNYVFFRLTNNYCDCDLPIGYGENNIKSRYLNSPHKRDIFLNSIYSDINHYINYLHELKNLDCISHIYWVKHWDNNEPEKSCPKYIIHVDDIDRNVLLNFKSEVAYKIQFYKKYY